MALLRPEDFVPSDGGGYSSMLATEVIKIKTYISTCHFRRIRPLERARQEG